MSEKFFPCRKFLERYRASLVGLVALIFASTLTEGAGIGLFFPLIEYIQKGEAFMREGASRRLFEALASRGLHPSVGGFIAAIFAVIALALILKFWLSVLSAGVYNALMTDLRKEAFGRIVRAHLFYFYSSSSATLAQILENEVEHVGQAFNFAVGLVSSSLLLLVLLGAVLCVSWKLTLLVSLIAALRYGVSGLFIRRVRRLGEEHSVLRTKLKATLIGVHQGIDVIKSFAAEALEAARFSELAARIKRNADGLALTAAGNACAEGLLGDGLLCLLVFAAVSRLQVSGAALLTFLLIVSRIIPKVTAINDARIRIAEYLSRVSFLPVVLAEGGLPVLGWGSARKEAFQDSLVLERVSFRYPGTEAPALQDIDLVLRPNETLAVVGGSGAGKTTLARLVLRLFDPDSGTVRLDGVPYPSLRREDFTRLIGVVSQDAFIFDDTVENNVLYAAPHAGRCELLEALRRARAEEFVLALPEKERTKVGERGVRLSGGQRQRIAIARAFLRRTPILILDEATSAMDAVTERLIQEAIAELSQDRAMVVIAHRFTTIRDADRIVVLEKGGIAEEGTHEELLANGPLYRRFHELQVDCRG